MQNKMSKKTIKKLNNLCRKASKNKFVELSSLPLNAMPLTTMKELRSIELALKKAAKICDKEAQKYRT